MKFGTLFTEFSGVWEVAGMRLAADESRNSGALGPMIVFLKLFDTIADSDEDPGIVID